MTVKKSAARIIGFNQILKEVRTSVFKLSLLDFSLVLGVSHTTVHRWEQNIFGIKYQQDKDYYIQSIIEKIVEGAYSEYYVS